MTRDDPDDVVSIAFTSATNDDLDSLTEHEPAEVIPIHGSRCPLCDARNYPSLGSAFACRNCGCVYRVEP